MNTKTIYAVALITAAGAAQAGTQIMLAGATQAGTVLDTYRLFDHPGGVVDPQAYGLRLDGLNVEDPMTFSFGSDLVSSTMTLQIIDNGDSLTLNMFGTVTGNSANGGTDFGTFDLDVSYTVFDVANGWEDNNSANGFAVGTLEGDFGSGNQIVNLFGDSDGSDTFRFLSDGHRIAGDNSAWVGRGWVLPDGNTGNTNDFLFQGVIVPLPAAAWGGLAMLGGLVAARRLRK